MVNFRKITEENFDAVINMKRPESSKLSRRFFFLIGAPANRQTAPG